MPFGVRISAPMAIDLVANAPGHMRGLISRQWQRLVERWHGCGILDSLQGLSKRSEAMTRIPNGRQDPVVISCTYEFRGSEFCTYKIYVFGGWAFALAFRPQMRSRSDRPASLRAICLRIGSSSRRFSPMRVPMLSRISARHALSSL